MRTAILKLIHEQSPQRPACFDTHDQWVEWLVSAHVGGASVVRRVDLGKHAGNRVTHFEVLPVGQQAHCQDCSARRQDQMKAAKRCFPVKTAPQARANEDEPQRAQFDVSGIAIIKKLGVRKEGKDDARILAIDAKIEIARVDASVCSYFDALLSAFLWRQEAFGRVVRNTALQPLAYSHQITGACVEIDGATFLGAEVGKFVIRPIDGTTVSLACTVAIYPGRANVSDLIARVQDGVQIRITGPADLFDEPAGDEPEAKPEKQRSLI